MTALDDRAIHSCSAAAMPTMVYTQGPPARCPFSPTFLVGRVPLLKIDYRKKRQLWSRAAVPKLAKSPHFPCIFYA